MKKIIHMMKNSRHHSPLRTSQTDWIPTFLHCSYLAVSLLLVWTWTDTQYMTFEDLHCVSLQDGHTALHLAVRRCQVEVVRCLLRHHCHLDQQDRHGNTPLHIACKDGNLPVVTAICNAKASLDLPNKVRTTTSHHTACSFRVRDAAQKLV